ncbi:Fur family zinc uptake transcriptional regulator [Hasllibacter halocynthiae]|uniref:Fur family zinc uptake transcriptional regulator n=1 Tax=Hasllibacter halocynthiae TaxID=595589 RepID=A0A2T0X7G1_9RHOB|nr:Fur family transcriptional regulator [Hasllibacter halocynthiae]PRY94835.1 Fur family zinc uptake transcriptional regulator [Hasllibacter halocynthiae]
MIDFAPHDHDGCIASALAAAEEGCAARGLRLTDARRRVLEILLESHRALGAYDVLDRLRAEGRPAQPPLVYRALDFLVAQGFVHRIERLNAFVACARPGAEHAPAFLICRACEAVAEMPVAPEEGRLGSAARATGFALEATTLEAEGLCPNCRGAVA